MEVAVTVPDTVSQVGTVRASVIVAADVSAVHGAAGEAAAGTADAGTGMPAQTAG